MTDRSDAMVVRWNPAGRAARRITFEPRDDGFLRVEQVRDHAGEWRSVGREVVDTVGVENVPAECVDDYDREASGGTRRLDDPEWSDSQTALDDQ
jgi:hypothetical protein